MRKSGLPVPVAALWCAVFAATALAQEAGRDPIKPQRKLIAGNPLWKTPLGELSETNARPLFSATRRPPAMPVLAALPAPPPNAGPPSTREPDHPRLTLVGTIVSESVEIGVFVDETSHDVVRLKAGDVHDGWTLSSVVGRTAIFQKEGCRAAMLVLPAPGAEPTAANDGTALPVIQPVAIQGPTLEPAVNPAATKGGSRRPPKEG